MSILPLYTYIYLQNFVKGVALNCSQPADPKLLANLQAGESTAKTPRRKFRGATEDDAATCGASPQGRFSPGTGRPLREQENPLT